METGFIQEEREREREREREAKCKATGMEVLNSQKQGL